MGNSSSDSHSNTKCAAPSCSCGGNTTQDDGTGVGWIVQYSSNILAKGVKFNQVFGPLLAKAGHVPFPTRTPQDKLDLPFRGRDFNAHFTPTTEVLGEGSFGKVYVAKYKKSPCPEFAIKEIILERKAGQRLDDIINEINIMGALTHPSIVKMYQYYAGPKKYHLVMEVIRGGELFARIVTKKTYNESDARDTMVLVLLAVEYMHVDKNIVHRDLKLDNLLLLSNEDDCHVKIADFGLAVSVENGPVKGHAGTPNYIAPEILTGKIYGASVDMWSLGVILYILLAGRYPFKDRNQQKLYQKICKGEYPQQGKQWSVISDEAKDLIHKMLTVSIEERITASEALRHPWITMVSKPELLSRDLTGNLPTFKQFEANRKLKVGIRSVMMAKRLMNGHA